MMRWRRTTACERAAQWISLDLDDELGELERAALSRHLERCGACRAVRAEIAGFTGVLRAAPLLERGQPIVIARPARARVRATRRVAVAVAAVAAVVAATLTALPSSSGPITSALTFRNAQEQRHFAQEHVRLEPAVFHVDAGLTPPSFASRALL
jgi:predicted anti-sigma-YlaC factor YlaD